MSLDQSLVGRVAAAVREGREDRVLLLLPTHRLQAQARELILTGAGPAGARRLGVLSFYQFVRLILDLASLRREPVDDALRRFILAHLLDQEAVAGRLPHFGLLAGSEGLAEAFGRLVGELKLAGVEPDDLAPALAAVATGEHAGYGEVAREISHLYRTYEDFLRERGLADKEELQLLARDALRASPELLRGYTLLLDGFFDLTPVQTQILEAAGEGATVEFAVPAAVRQSTPDWEGGGREPVLAHLARQLFQLSPEKAPAGEALRLVRAAGPEQEVRWVAKEIKRLCHEEGAGVGEVAVLTADAATYGPLITAVFAGEGIPCDQAVEDPLARNPLVQTVFLCLEAALGLFAGFDLLKLVRSGYLPGDEGHLAVLRRVFRERGYLFSRAEWERRLAVAEARWTRRAAAEAAGAGGDGDDGAVGAASETRRLLAELSRARELLPALLDPLEALPKRAPLPVHLAALDRLLETLGLERAALAPEVPERVRVRDWTALGVFRDVLARLSRAGNLLPEAGELNLGGFLATLKAAVTEARYPVTAAAPGGVAVMPVTQSRGLEFPYVFCLGVLDGVVPRPVREDWLLPEPLRRGLAAKGLLLDTAPELAAREKFLFHLAVTRATRRLYLSWPGSDAAGNALLGSAYLTEVRRLFSPEAAVEEVSTRRELVLYAREQVRYAASAAARRAAADGEPNPWAGSIVHPAARAMLAASRGPGYRWSAGHFGDYNRCPFRYFLQRELLAPPVEEAAEDLTPSERGQLLHEALRRYYREGGTRAMTWTAEERAAALRPILADLYDRSPARTRAPHSVFWEASRARAERQLLQVLERDVACFAATGFHPAYLEWGFGLTGGRDLDPASVAGPLRLGSEEEALTVVGKVDRVDLDDEGNFLVYDYKSGGIPTWQEERDGRSLQLRLYLRAVSELLLPEGRPVGAGFFSLAKADAREGIWHLEGAAKVNRYHRKKSAGLFDAPGFAGLLSQTENLAGAVARRVRAGEFPLTSDLAECRKCRFRGACRVDERVAVEEEEP